MLITRKEVSQVLRLFSKSLNQQRRIFTVYCGRPDAENGHRFCSSLSICRETLNCHETDHGLLLLFLRFCLLEAINLWLPTDLDAGIFAYGKRQLINLDGADFEDFNCVCEANAKREICYSNIDPSGINCQSKLSFANFLSPLSFVRSGHCWFFFIFPGKIYKIIILYWF